MYTRTKTIKQWGFVALMSMPEHTKHNATPWQTSVLHVLHETQRTSLPNLYITRITRNTTQQLAKPLYYMKHNATTFQTAILQWHSPTKTTLGTDQTRLNIELILIVRLKIQLNYTPSFSLQTKTQIGQSILTHLKSLATSGAA